MWLVAGIAGFFAVSCSQKPEPTPALESAATADPASAATTTPPADTAAQARQPETASTAAPATARSAKASVATRSASATTREAQPSVDSVPAAAPEPAPASTPASAGQDKWLTYDATTKTVTFELIAGPFTFNGYRNGGATLVVPPKANIVMNFINKDGTPHSAILISGDGAIPNSADDPAIPRAYTNKVLEGLPQEGTDVMRFPAPDSGTFRIFCGVPGHGLSGMWIWMKVEPGAKVPSFGPTKA
jgi:hypothetical protein